MISGVGMDIVDIARLRLALRRSPGFAEMVFTPQERRASVRRLAAVFAAKEAFLKAVGLGLWRGVPLQEVEVVGSSFRLGRRAAKALRDRGCSSAELSLSHSRDTAIAVVAVH